MKAKKASIYFLLFFWVVGILVLFSMIINHFSTNNFTIFFENKYFLFSLALLSTYFFGFNFIKKTYYEIFIWKNIGMNTLIFLSTQTSIIFSIYQLANNLYPDLVDVGIFVILFVKTGDYITNKIKGFVSKDLKRITSLIPTRVIKISNDVEEYVNINIVNVNDVIKIKSNEIIPLDGILLNDKANVNTQIIDGENISKTFFKNDFIFSGMKCESDSLLLLVKNKYTDSFINKVITKVITIQSEKSKLQTIIDKITIYFTPLIVFLSLFGFLISYFLINKYNLYVSLKILVTILVSACPCSLGIAIPFAIMIGSTKAAKKGIIFNRPESFQKFSSIDVVAFDKTGTLTDGEIKVKKFTGNIKFLEIIGLIEKQLIHPIATGVINYLWTSNIKLNNDILVEKIDNQTFIINKNEYKILPISDYNLNLKSNINIDFNKIENTTSLIIENNIIVAMIEFEDQIRNSSYNSINNLKKMGLEVVMITGDNIKVAHTVANELNIDKVYAQKNINEKLDIIKKYQTIRKKVLYVGDGINDILAIQKADLSISVISKKAFLNLESDINLLNPDINLISESIKLAKYTKKLIYTNLFWAFIYNIVVIPLSIIGILTPIIGMFMMFFSSILVLLNTLIFKLIK